MYTLRRRIAKGLREKMDDVFLKILREELQNSRQQTAKRLMIEDCFYELMDLFSLVNSIL